MKNVIYLTPIQLARFWSRLNILGDEECWEWQARKDKHGYGLTFYNEENWFAHRIAWIVANGAIPDGQCVLHRCDNPSCVNPSHLFLGTRADNHADMVEKGRNKNPQKPVRGHGAKLSQEEVEEIELLIEDGFDKWIILGEYGICNTTYYHIKYKRYIANPQL